MSIKHQNKTLSLLLQNLDLGVSVAEHDNLLQAARVETSAFSDLLNDRVDLIPGTKGSGKSSLFRMFVDFMPEILLRQRKVVVAHGVQAPGDPIFHVFNDQFAKLSEQEFVSFWCIYLVSLAHEQFIKHERFTIFLKDAQPEIQRFRTACEKAKIPEIAAKKSLKSILEWTLNVLKSFRPKGRYHLPDDGGVIEVDLFGEKIPESKMEAADALPIYINEVKTSLEAVLEKSDLSLWLMVDRLDEIFQRRSEVEKRALRGLLRAMQFFAASNIKVKLFLRDDMLEQLVVAEEGFTALTHITARQADTLRWTEEQILTLIMTRFSANQDLCDYLGMDRSQIAMSAAYRKKFFDIIFPPSVFKKSNQSSTLRWIYSHCADSRGVVTPRDVLDLLIRAKQKQQSLCQGDSDAFSDYMIDGAAIKYGFQDLSRRKMGTYLQAEFPHLWPNIEKFVDGKTEYNDVTLQNLLGKDYKNIAKHLIDIGFLRKGVKAGKSVFSVPHIYRPAINLTQGTAR